MITKLKKGTKSFVLSEVFDKSFFKSDDFEFKLVKFADDLVDLNFLGIDNPRMFSRRMLHILMLLKQMQFEKYISNIKTDRIGIYCSSYKHLCPVKVIEAIQNEKISVSKSMRLNCNPNHTLINNGSILSSHISIKYNINGPTNFFEEGAATLLGSVKAYQKATFDLKLNIIDLALVVCGNFFDDFFSTSSQLNHVKFVNKKNKACISDIILKEAIICSIIDHKSNLNEISAFAKNCTENLIISDDESLGVIDVIKSNKYIWSSIHE